jgi:hypothetical protein
VLIVCVQGAAVLLVTSGRRHQRNRRELVHHLGRHRVLSRRAARVVSRVLPAVSIAVGAAALLLPTVAVLLAPATWLSTQRAVAGIEAMLYFAFLGYLALLRRRAPQEKCGCLGSADERTSIAIIRASVIGVAAVLIAAGLPGAELSSLEGWSKLYLLATAVGAFAGVLAGGFTDFHARTGIGAKKGWPA